MTSALTHRNPESSALELPGRVPIVTIGRMPLAKPARSTRSSPPLYERYTVASTARSYTPLPRTGVWVFGEKPHAPSPRATLIDAGKKAAICLAPLVRTSNASPPAFLEGLLWNHSRVIPLSHAAGPIHGARPTLLVRATEAETAVTTIALRKRGEISPYEL